MQIQFWRSVVKKVKASHTRYRALGLELIPVYRQVMISHPPGSRLPLLSARRWVDQTVNLTECACTQYDQSVVALTGLLSGPRCDFWSVHGRLSCWFLQWCVLALHWTTFVLFCTSPTNQRSTCMQTSHVASLHQTEMANNGVA